MTNMNFYEDTTIEQNIPDGTQITIHGGNLKINASIGDNVTINSGEKIVIRGNVGNAI